MRVRFADAVIAGVLLPAAVAFALPTETTTFKSVYNRVSNLKEIQAGTLPGDPKSK